MRTRTSTKSGSGKTSLDQVLYRYNASGQLISQTARKYDPVKFIGGGTSSTMIDKVSDSLRPKLNITSNGSYKVKPSDVFKPVNPCRHQKSSINLEDDISMAPKYSASAIYNLRGNAAGYLYYMKGLSVSNIDGLINSSSYYGQTPNIDTPSWDSLYSQFDEKASSFISSSFLIGEDLAQPGIFIDAFKLIVNPTNALKLFVNTAVKRFSRRSSHTLGHVAKELLRSSSNAHLFYNFGIKPMVKDIRDTFSAHRRVTDRMSFLLRNRGAFVPIRASIIKTIETPSVDINETYMQLATIRGSYTVSLHIGAHGRVRRDITANDAWRAYLQYFGINKVVGLAWELIPFSFVVDWVTNVQESINKLTRIDIGSPFNEFHGFTCSSKLVESSPVILTDGVIQTLASTVTTDTGYTRIGNSESSVYERMLSVPEDLKLVRMSDLGFFQLMTGGALLFQRLLR